MCIFHLQARVYLLSAGFSLAFGSMFTKTYRVHRIFTRSRSGVVKNKVADMTIILFSRWSNAKPIFVSIRTSKTVTRAFTFLYKLDSIVRNINRKDLSPCTFQLLQDTQLIFLICMLLVIDVVVVTLWVSLDPMQRHLQNLTLEISPQDRGVVYQPQVINVKRRHTRARSFRHLEQTTNGHSWTSWLRNHH